MRTRILLLFLLAACHPPARTALTGPPMPPGAAHILSIDLAECRPAVGAPTYDGNFWHFAAGPSSLRCPIAIEAGDYVFGWLVHGRHTVAGPQVTSACLQRLETVMSAEADRHFDVVCKSDAATAITAFSIYAPMYEPPWGVMAPWGTSEDDIASLLISSTGPGDFVGAATVYLTRP